MQGVNQKTAGGWVFSHREMVLNWPFTSTANIACHIFSSSADDLCLSPMKHVVAAANEAAAATRTADLALASVHAGELAQALAEAGQVPGERGSGWRDRARPRVAPLAPRLLGMAARLLPEADRARYAEEFRCEVWELAAAGAARWGQRACAARVLTRAWETWAALRATARRQAVP